MPHERTSGKATPTSQKLMPTGAQVDIPGIVVHCGVTRPMHTVAEPHVETNRSHVGPESATLNANRDILARRVWRGAALKGVRTVFLVVADICGVFLASALVASVISRPLGGVASVAFVSVFAILGQAARSTYRPAAVPADFGRVIQGVLIGFGALCVARWLYPQLGLDLVPHAIMAVAMALAFSGSRWALAQLAAVAHRKGVGCQRVLLVGAAREVRRIREQIQRVSDPRICLVGFISSDSAEDGGSLGTIDSIGSIIDRHNIDVVLVATHLAPGDLGSVSRECLYRGARVGLMPDRLDGIQYEIAADHVLGSPMLELRLPSLHVLQLALKRALDVVVSLLGLILLAPLFLIIAIAIWVDSPGPVFFRQMRPGLGGQLFPMLKFRTMRVDAEDVLRQDADLYRRFLENDCKLPEGEDPRIFPVGRILRKTSLDELPQLINVLRGEMSLVGPRPIVGPEIEHYGNHRTTFLSVKPGITGYWQVNGRSTVAYPERAHMDLTYIKHWSLLLDLKILLMTLPAVLMRRGAH